MASTTSISISHTLNYLDGNGGLNIQDLLDDQDICPSNRSLETAKQSPNAAFFDIDALSSSVKEALVVFAVTHDESYRAAVKAAWSLRQKFTSQNFGAFLRLYLGLCVKDLVHTLNLPPSILQDKLDQYLSMLDVLSTDKFMNSSMTAGMQSLFKTAIRESCHYFKSVSESTVEKERLFEDYRMSEFGSKLSSRLQKLASYIFPELHDRNIECVISDSGKLLNGEIFGDQTSVENETPAMRDPPSSKVSSNDKQLRSSSRTSHQTTCREDPRVKSALVCIVPLEQMGRTIQEVNCTDQNVNVDNFTDDRSKTFTSNNGPIMMKKCSVKLSRINLKEYSNGHQVPDYQHQNSSDKTKRSRNIESPYLREPGNLNPKRNRKAREGRVKAVTPTNANKENSSAINHSFETESVPSSDVEELEMESCDNVMLDKDLPVGEKKTIIRIPVPNLEQFIRIDNEAEINMEPQKEKSRSVDEFEVDEEPKKSTSRLDKEPDIDKEVDKEPDVDEEPQKTKSRITDGPGNDKEPQVDELQKTTSRAEKEPEVGEEPQKTKSRVDKEPEVGEEPQKTKSRIAERPEIDEKPQKTKSKADKEPEVDEPQKTKSRADKEPEVGEEPQKTKLRADKEPEVGEEPQKTKLRVDGEPEVGEEPQKINKLRADKEPQKTKLRTDKEPQKIKSRADNGLEIDDEPQIVKSKADKEPEFDEEPQRMKSRTGKEPDNDEEPQEMRSIINEPENDEVPKKSKFRVYEEPVNEKEPHKRKSRRLNKKSESDKKSVKRKLKLDKEDASEKESHQKRSRRIGKDSTFDKAPEKTKGTKDEGSDIARNSERTKPMIDDRPEIDMDVEKLKFCLVLVEKLIL